MSETYCGKSCQTCGYRAETSCRGCLEEASRECKLALCCRQKGHKTCDSCTYNTQCGMYRGRDTAPQFRLAQKQAVLEYQQSLREKGTVMTLNNSSSLPNHVNEVSIWSKSTTRPVKKR